MSDPYGIVTFDVDGKLQSSYDFLEYLKGVLDALGARIDTEAASRAVGDAQLSLRVDGFNDTFLEGVQISLADLLNRINTETAARIAGDAANAGGIADLDVSLGNVAASIVQEASVRASELTAISSLITALDARVGSSEAAITNEQTTRATADTALATQLTAFNVRVGAAESSIVTEQTARANGDSALATTINTLTTRVGSAESMITTEAVARTAENYALATRLDTLEASVDGIDFSTIEAEISSEATVRANADSALATRTSTVEAQLNDTSGSALQSRISNEETARANADGALATQINNVTTTVNGHTASITSTASSVDGLLLRHSILLNSNGHITGFVQNNNGTTGSFTVVADVFTIVAPNGSNPVTPFTVTAEGVRIGGNLIVEGSITGDRIGDDEIDTPQIAAGSVSNTLQVYNGSYYSGTGISFYYVIAEQTINVIYPAEVIIWANISQGFPSGDKSWQAQIFVDGNLIHSSGGAKTADSVAMSGKAGLGVGTHTVQLRWAAQSSVFVNAGAASLITLRTYV